MSAVFAPASFHPLPSPQLFDAVLHVDSGHCAYLDQFGHLSTCLHHSVALALHNTYAFVSKTHKAIHREKALDCFTPLICVKRCYTSEAMQSLSPRCEGAIVITHGCICWQEAIRFCCVSVFVTILVSTGSNLAFMWLPWSCL